MPVAFDQLWAVSDLHMGGVRQRDRDFQIFNQGERLSLLINRISQPGSNDQVALVLNGDIFDSLAEDIGGYVALDEAGATRLMNRLYKDGTFAPVWQSLADFIALPNRHLVLLVGNHDIELALPVVRDSLRERLSRSKPDRNPGSRLHFAAYGEGFRCQVGPAQVYCTHGNEVDDWNAVNFDQLSQLGNAINAGRRPDPTKWKPNPGTRLVIDVMNPLKERYPFVDLLKPMAASITGILLAIDREAMKDVDPGDLYPIARDWFSAWRSRDDRLGAEGASAAPELPREEVLNQLLGASFRESVLKRDSELTDENRLLMAAEAALGQDPEELEDSGLPEVLGAWDYVGRLLDLLPRSERVQKALSDWFVDERAWDATSPDAQYENIIKRVGDGVDFVITGHTHQPKALRFGGSGYYYNCGTWIRTLRLTREVLADVDTFDQELWPVLTAGSMAALEQARIPGPNNRQVPLLQDRTHVVRISATGNGAVGELLQVTLKNKKPVLKREPGTQPFQVGLP